MVAEPIPSRLSGPERLAVLLDEGSFAPYGAAESPLLLGAGEVTGRSVFVHARSGDAPLAADDYHRLARMSEAAAGAPVIGVFDSPGARDDPAVLAAQRDVLARIAGGGAPRIAVVLGRAVGFDAIVSSMHHAVVLAQRAAETTLAGPALTGAVTNEWVSGQALGGADAHAAASGFAHVVAANEVEALLCARRLVQLACPGRPACPGRAPARLPGNDDIEGLGTLLPRDDTRPYAMDQLLAKVVDAGTLLELGGATARNVLTGLARLGGHGVGVAANRPEVLGGALDLAACRKLRVFAGTCRVLGLPLVSLIDVPGFLPGVAQEHGGLAFEAGALAAAMGGAVRASIVVRRGLGPALAILGGPDGARACWSGARLGATHASAAPNPLAAGLVDRVIPPEATRSFLIETLDRAALDGTTP